ncbi:MAG: CRTAC1 family protein [Planctomycetales bacterium]|nr:CRTAC1 family protein [Planctomycetales bacterium]
MTDSVRGLIIVLIVAQIGCISRKSIENAESRETKESIGFDIDVATFSRQSSQSIGLDTSIRLTQMQQEMQLSHVYENGQQGRALLVETIGGGGGWLDYDCDGRLDLYLNQGGDPTQHNVDSQPLDQLFHNRDRSTVVAVAAAARIVEPFYSQGVGIADYDNDGFDDIYVTNVGRNTLWQNCGDGTFVEIAQAAGVDDPRWSTSVAWADLDHDSDLDLYVCNYCNYDPRFPKACKDSGGFDILCNPAGLEPWPDACFINLGDGTFADEAVQRGLIGPNNRSLGVAAADFNNDGWIDLYVANDTTENFLFVNDGNGHFTDEAPLRGCAVDRMGATQGSMGVAVADYDQNGYLDIYCTHYFEESNTLYANFGERGFSDQTAATGLHLPTLTSLGFGTVFSDLNADGLPELIIANGHVNNARRAPDPRMRPQMFAFAGNTWTSIAEQAADFFSIPSMGRGVSLGDYDSDGDLDVVVVNENDPTVLLRNDSARENWLQIRLLGRESNRAGIGSTIVASVGDSRFLQQLCGGTSFAVSNEPVLCFGFGGVADEVALEVRWPDGHIQKLQTPPNRKLTILEEF